MIRSPALPAIGIAPKAYKSCARGSASRGKHPSWLVSVLVHVGCLLLLSLFAFSTAKPTVNSGLIAGSALEVEFEQLVDVEIDTDELEEMTDPLLSDMEDPGEVEV